MSLSLVPKFTGGNCTEHKKRRVISVLYKYFHKVRKEVRSREGKKGKEEKTKEE
jgi:hypothetical protein